MKWVRASADRSAISIFFPFYDFNDATPNGWPFTARTFQRKKRTLGMISKSREPIKIVTIEKLYLRMSLALSFDVSTYAIGVRVQCTMCNGDFALVIHQQSHHDATEAAQWTRTLKADGIKWEKFIFDIAKRKTRRNCPQEQQSRFSLFSACDLTSAFCTLSEKHRGRERRDNGYDANDKSHGCSPS